MHINIKDSLVKQFLKGLEAELMDAVLKIPEDWDGIELRWLFKEKAAEYVWQPMVDKRSKRYKAFKNFCLVNNI